MPESGRTYGCLEVEFPDEDERPSDGYAELGIRASVTFDNKIEVFDALSEFDHAEGVLRYRAQEMSDTPHERASIKEAVDDYARAANQLMLWDPKARFDFRQGLDDLFKERDWTPFISPGAFAVPNVDISNVQVISKDIDDDWLVKFFYVNGDVSGWELEYAVLKKGKMFIRTDSSSALRSASPAFRGQQLPQVYAALQRALEEIPVPLDAGIVAVGIRQETPQQGSMKEPKSDERTPALAGEIPRLPSAIFRASIFMSDDKKSL